MEKPFISTREAEILEKLCLGMNSIEIANSLFISEHTVRTHRKNILRKLGVSSSLLAIRMYLEGNIFVRPSSMQVAA